MKIEVHTATDPEDERSAICIIVDGALVFEADDGSPLGEWVPINPDAELCHRWEDPETGEETDLRTINVQDANRIIRGEVEQ